MNVLLLIFPMSFKYQIIAILIYTLFSLLT
jgi:hypothetical protein